MATPELVFICQYKIGGVQNFYFNLLKGNDFTGFQTKLIYTNNQDDHETKLPGLFGCAHEEHLFGYKQTDSTFGTFKKLRKIIGGQDGFIFTNFPLELGCLQHYPSGKTVGFVVHDEWYIQNAIRYGFLIDVYIAHNPGIFDLLKRLLPDRREDIHYLPYGVEIPENKKKENISGTLKILFTGRLHPLKGIFDLPLIDDELKKRGVNCEWTIIGDGPERPRLIEEIRHRGNFTHKTPETNKEVLEIAAAHDVFVLPSRLEGMPVSMLEAMSVGLVPVLAEFNEGIKKVVTETEGFVLPVGDITAFANSIIFLHNDRLRLQQMSNASRNKVEQQFNATKNAEGYYNLVKKFRDLRSPRKTSLPVKYGNGRLDTNYMPDAFLKGIRFLSGIVKRK